jgi:hypothetical protein
VIGKRGRRGEGKILRTITNTTEIDTIISYVTEKMAIVGL